MQSAKAAALALFLATFAAHEAGAQTPNLGRGINIFEHSYDPIWFNRDKSPFKDETFKVIRKSGFQTVRVPVVAFGHMDASNTIDPNFLRNLDWVVDHATAAGLNVIIDEHDYRACAASPEICEPKVSSFWQQVAPRYKDRPSSVTFELLNEPQQKLTPELWNQMLVRELAIVRQTNPTRAVLVDVAVGGTFKGLPLLQLPDNDHNLIVDVHYYEPYKFTHQGQPDNIKYSMLHGLTWGAPDDFARMKADFDAVQAWGVQHHRPLILGEFGVLKSIPQGERARWTGAMARMAEAHHMAWAVFEFSSEYGIYDLDTGQWDPALLKALIPN